MVLGDLRDKYLRMRTLRARHGRARTDASYAEPDPRPEMKRLAAEFPGALREIDRLPLAVIDERIAALDAAIAEGPPAPWMTAQLLFHAYARAALAAKRWLGRRRTVDAALTAAFVVACPEAVSAAPDLALIAAPLSGRVMNVVHMHVAARLGLSVEETRQLLVVATSHEPPRLCSGRSLARQVELEPPPPESFAGAGAAAGVSLFAGVEPPEDDDDSEPPPFFVEE